MKESAWFRDAIACLERDIPAVLVAVAKIKGSAPRSGGTAMIVTPDRTLGTIGGGSVEFEAITHARKLLAGEPLARRSSAKLGPAIDQCCGGRIDLVFHRLDAGDLETLRAARPEASTILVGADAAATLAVPCGPEETPDGAALLPIRENDRPVAIYGAGHVGQALVTALLPLPFDISWIDGRADVFPADLSAEIMAVAAAIPEAHVAALPDNAFHVVMTHSHALDLEIVAAVLERGTFGFLGLIGSKTKHRHFLKLLDERGLGEAARERLTCPIGLPGITGKRPEVIAASVAAQLLQLGEAGP